MSNTYFITKVRDFIDNNQLISTDKGPILVGVSGGCDSVVLLDVLIKSGYDCIIAHCNFNLRSKESLRDEKFVRKLAKSYDIPYLGTDFQTIEYSKRHGISVEMAARELRYEWFEKMRVFTKSAAIVVGHHRDDNIESILLNIARGTGLKGLVGMPLRNGYVIRPLLGSSRDEIREYATNNKLKFVEDSSNQSTEFKRNKIRHEIIPLFEELNPNFRQRLIETKNNLEEASNFANDQLSKIRTDFVKKESGKMFLDIKKIARHQHKKFILFETLYPYGFNPDQIDEIVNSLKAESGRTFSSKTHELLKDRNHWIVREIANKESADNPNNQHDKMPEIQIQLLTRSAELEITGNDSMIMVDADKMQFPYTIRQWKAADFFYPMGMKMRTKKISDLLIDKKIDRFSKEQVWLLLSGEEIVWVIGIQPDERFKITDKTRNIAILKIKNKAP